MGYYKTWTDDALAAEMELYRAAIKAAVLGGETQQVWGEGRRLIVTTVNLQEARNELAAIVNELSKRTGYCHLATGGAIVVEIG